MKRVIAIAAGLAVATFAHGAEIVVKLNMAEATGAARALFELFHDLEAGANNRQQNQLSDPVARLHLAVRECQPASASQWLLAS